MGTIHWNSAVSGDWATASNWSGGVIPGATSDAIIDPVGTYNVAIDQAEAVHSLTVNDAGAHVLLTNTLTLGNTLDVSAGTFELGGQILGGTLTFVAGSPLVEL